MKIPKAIVVLKRLGKCPKVVPDKVKVGSKENKYPKTPTKKQPITKTSISPDKATSTNHLNGFKDDKVLEKNLVPVDNSQPPTLTREIFLIEPTHNQAPKIKLEKNLVESTENQPPQLSRKPKCSDTNVNESPKSSPEIVPIESPKTSSISNEIESSSINNNQSSPYSTSNNDPSGSNENEAINSSLGTNIAHLFENHPITLEESKPFLTNKVPKISPENIPKQATVPKFTKEPHHYYSTDHSYCKANVDSNENQLPETSSITSNDSQVQERNCARFPDTDVPNDQPVEVKLEPVAEPEVDLEFLKPRKHSENLKKIRFGFRDVSDENSIGSSKFQVTEAVSDDTQNAPISVPVINFIPSTRSIVWHESDVEGTSNDHFEEEADDQSVNEEPPVDEGRSVHENHEEVSQEPDRMMDCGLEIADIRKNTKGVTSLYFEKHRFRLDRRFREDHQGPLHWRCIKYRAKNIHCRVKVVTNHGYIEVYPDFEHNHAGQPLFSRKRM